MPVNSELTVRISGKDATGTITLAVTQVGNEVGVEVRDDGAGLNLPRIREKGIQNGLLAPGQEITDVAQAEARQAGTIVEDDGEGFQKIVDFLAELKVI